MIRDIICFLPLILILLTMYDIEGILFAASAANFIVMIVAASLSVAYMRTLKSESTSAADTAAEKNAVIRDTYKGVIIMIKETWFLWKTDWQDDCRETSNTILL